MKQFITIICLGVIISCSCNNKYSKKDHLFTYKIENLYFVESYRTDSYGVGGDVYSTYLTDSTNFRKFICIYYDNEHVSFSFDNNIMTAVRKKDAYVGLDGIYYPKIVLEKYALDIDILIKTKAND